MLLPRALPLIALFPALLLGQPKADEIARWKEQAKRITITRDQWGIAHVSGKTDADAVFGALFVQAEDDFPRIEANYLTALGRTAEAEGEKALYQDLRARLYLSPAKLQAHYEASPAWLQKLMNAFADGLNYYLYTHPETKPRVLNRFEPWMALSFTEGSIGGDIEKINLRELQAFYGGGAPLMAATPEFDTEPRGSNGIAIAPSNTAAKKALLLINPHTSFYFRSELQMASQEGLNAYGAATWGQFFIYQGFNERTGWMHTTSGVDVIDEYRERVTPTANGYQYKHGKETRPVQSESVTLRYRTPSGPAQRTFVTYRTHHGPIVRASNGQWISVAMMDNPVQALSQSYLRTKARNYRDFRDTMELKTNSSNNTIYADADGVIAYFHGNFLPKRNPRFDWLKPVDGSDPATDWGPSHALTELPEVIQPKSGWLYNANNAPWSAAGADSPKQGDFPKYVERGEESARGLHAIQLLSGKKDYTLDSLVTAAYDSHLPWFTKPIPALVRAWENTAANSPIRALTAPQIALLKGWDHRFGVNSIPTSLAIFWAQELQKQQNDRPISLAFADDIAGRIAPEVLLQALVTASEKLTQDYGKWQTPWGEINRFQRLTGDIVHPFDDAKASLPVGFTSGSWGALAVFGAGPKPGTKKWYGTSGNSFVAVVEFGKRVRARAITAGGESGDPNSPHFRDQAERYSAGNLREVNFYPEQIQANAKRTYQP